MFRSHLRLAIRTLRRRFGYTIVNLIGLTVGLACCAVVAVFLEYELTYDAHHEDADRIYRLLWFDEATPDELYSTVIFKNSFRARTDEQQSLARGVVATIPEVEQATNFEIFSDRNDRTYVETDDGDRFETDRYLMTNTGPAFTDLFTFERLAGAPLDEALTEPYSAVLPRSTAETYFGDQNPIGKTFTVDSLQATVRAVIEDPPANSRIRFDFAMQVKRIPNWGAYHYLRLAEGADPETVAPKVTDVYDRVRPSRLEDETVQASRLQALTDIHFAERAAYDDTPHRDPAYLWFFGAVGGLILLITTINYANLGLALYADRNEEIGVRKAMGGYPGQIAGQFLTEAILIALICVPLAVGVCTAILPAFNELMGTQIDPWRLAQPLVLGSMIGLAVLVGLAAGGYPAVVLARRRAVDLFDRGLSFPGGPGGWSLRHGLIALQFVVLIGLGSLTWVAYSQLQFMQEDALGYDTANVVRTNFSGDSTAYQQFRQRVTQSSAVEAAGFAGASGTPGTPETGAPFSLVESDRTYQGAVSRRVDIHWFDVMGIEHPVVDSMRAAGSSSAPRYLINRAAADVLQAEDVVGKTWDFTKETDPDTKYPIAGVLPTLHLNPMRDEAPPALYEVYRQAPFGYNVLVRLAPGRTQDGLAHIQSVWSDMKPDTPLTTTFLTEEVANLYQQERRFTALGGTLALLAIVMAVIGLAALVTYLTRLRRKEIGIRKALGGSVSHIVATLNAEYLRIVGVAFAAGAPLAWLAADWWLGRFAYQVELSVLPFTAAGVGALVVAVGAVSLQALRAARVDPSRVLRSE
jgi:putative ABC transport system permease protein